eukprot:gnl/Trimastix_PCT/1399.p1 GENE.gnl/Trimastix_PCT/1399~~gnl/Trimastix_PCT/1399.p1  ORF type:complete len:281 (-),score=79.67 gnl/Trimastix_PCT/1399:94-936(-)
MGNLGVRLITVAIAAPMWFLSSIYSPWIFKCLITMLIVIGTMEYEKMGASFLGLPSRFIMVLHCFVACIVPMSSFLESYASTAGVLGVCMFFLFLVHFIRALYLGPERYTACLTHFLFAWFGLVWISWTITHGFFIVDHDKRWMPLLLAGNWASDGFALFVGKPLGRHKLCAQLSPKKTWEGFLGGCFFGTIVPNLFLLPLHNRDLLPLPDVEPAMYFVATMIVAILTQLGDLVESFVKRAFQCKDSGSFFPGHGGVLDRIDGLFAAAVPFYFLMMYATA